jgi:hypothetical protein
MDKRHLSCTGRNKHRWAPVGLTLTAAPKTPASIHPVSATELAANHTYHRPSRK